MVDLDLKKLSAPLTALREEIAKAYKRLDAKWDEIAKCLKGSSIPCDVSFEYSCDPNWPDNCSHLAWKKWNGKKRICIEFHHFDPNSDYGPTVTTIPYEEWGGEQRIEMLEHVPGLFQAAAEQTKKFIEKSKV